MSSFFLRVVTVRKCVIFLMESKYGNKIVNRKLMVLDNPKSNLIVLTPTSLLFECRTFQF
jgi:hypothetical protein